MPLRDHFHPRLADTASWEKLHGGWPMVIVQQLRTRLAPGYVAGPRVHAGGLVEIDVAACERGDARGFVPYCPARRRCRRWRARAGTFSPFVAGSGLSDRGDRSTPRTACCLDAGLFLGALWEDFHHRLAGLDVFPGLPADRPDHAADGRPDGVHVEQR